MKIRTKQINVEIKGTKIEGRFTKGQLTKAISKVTGNKAEGAIQAAKIWKAKS